jgi:hypothetical protein
MAKKDKLMIPNYCSVHSKPINYNVWRMKNEIIGEMITKPKYVLFDDNQILPAIVSDTVDILIKSGKLTIAESNKE